MASSNLGNETGDLNSPRASVPSEKFESKKSSDEEEVAIPSPNDLSLHKEESNDHKIIISSENIHESNPFNSELSDKMIPNTNPSIVIQENTATTTTPAENYSTNMDIVE